MTQKRKNDAESAELKTQNYYSAAPPYPSRKFLRRSTSTFGSACKEEKT